MKHSKNYKLLNVAGYQESLWPVRLAALKNKK